MEPKNDLERLFAAINSPDATKSLDGIRAVLDQATSTLNAERNSSPAAVEDDGVRTLHDIWEVVIISRCIRSVVDEGFYTDEDLEPLLDSNDKVYTVRVALQSGGTLIYSSDVSIERETYLTRERAINLRKNILSANKIKLKYWIPVSENFLDEEIDWELSELNAKSVPATEKEKKEIEWSVKNDKDIPSDWMNVWREAVEDYNHSKKRNWKDSDDPANPYKKQYDV